MILLTFLGAGRYEPTEYEWQGQRRKTVYSAASSAIFLKPERVIVFLTREARERNLNGLKSEMEAEGFSIETVDIPLGKNESELWEIFNIINEQTPEMSEIAFDVTNGQRSLPLLGILAAMFMKTGREINIIHLFYGAYNVDPESAPGKTPIFDLSPMLQLLDWSVAADRFNRFGDSSDMANLLFQFGRNVAKRNIGNRTEQEKGSNFQKLGKSLDAISDAYLLLRPMDVIAEVGKLKSNIDQITPVIASFREIKPLELLLERIQATYLRFGAEREAGMELEDYAILHKELEMILWYQDHGHVMQAVSLAREWLLSWVMLWLGVESIMDKEIREPMNRSINLFVKLTNRKENDQKKYSRVTEEIFRENYGENPYDVEDNLLLIVTTEKIKAFTDVKAFTTLWDKLCDIRNDIDHAGHRNGSLNADALIKQSRNQIETLRKLPLPNPKKQGAA